MALERLEPPFSSFSIYLRLSMIESPQEMSNTGELLLFARDSLHSRAQNWRTKAWHDDAN